MLEFVFACYGMTMILMYGKIFNKIRPKQGFFGSMLECSMCTGFWVGIFNSFLLNMGLNFFVCGCISAGTTYILDKIIGDEGIVIKNN